MDEQNNKEKNIVKEENSLDKIYEMYPESDDFLAENEEKRNFWIPLFVINLVVQVPGTIVSFYFHTWYSAYCGNILLGLFVATMFCLFIRDKTKKVIMYSIFLLVGATTLLLYPFFLYLYK